MSLLTPVQSCDSLTSAPPVTVSTSMLSNNYVFLPILLILVSTLILVFTRNRDQGDALDNILKEKLTNEEHIDIYTSDGDNGVDQEHESEEAVSSFYSSSDMASHGGQASNG